MNNQNILNHYGYNFDIKLDNSEYCDFQIGDNDFDYIPNNPDSNPLSIVFDSSICTGMTMENEIGVLITGGTCEYYIEPRTEKGWTLDFIFNKESLPWISGSTFYYWGIKDETNPLYYRDNNLSFSFTPEGNVKWESYRYTGYCQSGYTTGDTISNTYTESGYISSGITPTLCSGGTSNDFNLIIKFERDRRFINCQIYNEGGLNSQITGYTVTNPLGVMTGDTEEYTLTNVLNQKWLNERNLRMGTLKFYLNGKLFHKEDDWEEIIPTVRGSLNPIVQILGSGTTGCEDIHLGVTQFNIKRVRYYENPLTFTQVQNSYTNDKSTYNITECNSQCVDRFPFLTYLVQPNLSYIGMEDWGFMEMEFLTGYTPTEIGNSWIEPGGGLSPIYSEFPFPQPTNKIENGNLIYRYTYDSLHPNLHVQYPIIIEDLINHKEASPIKFRVNLFSDGTKTSESINSLNLYFLNIVGVLDISKMIKINHLDISFSEFDTLILPNTVNPETGFDVHLYNVSNLKQVDMSSMILSMSIESEIQIWYCDDIEIINLPSMGVINRLEISSLPVINIVQSGSCIYNHTIIIQDCPKLESISGLSNSSPLTNLIVKLIKPDYFDVTIFPNLTNRSGESPGVGEPCLYDLSQNSFSAASVNRILNDFVSISSGGYTNRKINLTGNFPPDSSSGGYDGLAAKSTLQSMGFTVLTT